MLRVCVRLAGGFELNGDLSHYQYRGISKGKALPYILSHVGHMCGPPSRNACAARERNKTPFQKGIYTLFTSKHKSSITYPPQTVLSALVSTSYRKGRHSKHARDALLRTPPPAVSFVLDTVLLPVPGRHGRMARTHGDLSARVEDPAADWEVRVCAYPTGARLAVSSRGVQRVCECECRQATAHRRPLLRAVARSGGRKA